MLRGVKAEIAALTARRRRPPCTSPSRPASSRPPSGPISTNDTIRGHLRERLVGKVPYVYGGFHPRRLRLLRFTMYVYSHFGVGLLAAMRPRPPQQAGTQSVPIGQEQPGDLGFFGSPAYHRRHHTSAAAAWSNAAAHRRHGQLRLGGRRLGIRPALT